MPLYRYLCPHGHEAELVRPMGARAVECSCGAEAQRQSVYRLAVIGNAAVPRDERNYRHEYSEYSEAMAEVSDFYNTKRANGDPVREPDYYSLARQQAAAQGVAVRGPECPAQ